MMEEGYALGFNPDYKPPLGDINFEVVMAVMAMLAISPNMDLEKLKIAIDAIEQATKKD